MHKIKALPAAALLALGALGATQVLAQTASADVPAADAQRVIIDPDTGKLRQPTPAEVRTMEARAAAIRAARALAAPSPAAKPAAPAEPMVRSVGNGVQRARLTDAFHSHSVVVRRADGTLDTQCHETHDTALQALQKARSEARPAARAELE